MASPLEVLPPPVPKVVQIACWGGDRGPEVLYALRDDGTIWRANISGQVGLVWFQVPPIDDGGGETGKPHPFQGELSFPLDVGPVLTDEKQW